MDLALKPKHVAPWLLVGILVLIGATALGVLLPASRRSPDRTAGAERRDGTSLLTEVRSPSPRQLSSRPDGAAERLPAAPVLSTITYTVGPRDTGPRIARWFEDHGYAALFAINKEVFASRRRLLSPGWRVTIRNGVMTIARPSATPPHGNG